MKIPFYRPAIGEDDIEAVTKTLRSGWISRGPVCGQFEQAFADYIGAAHAVAVNSGTAALVCALSASGIGPGDLVVVPSLTFTATAQAVIISGASPLFADCDPETLTLDPAAMRQALDDYLRRRRPDQPLPAAMIPVHFGGIVGPIEAYREIARDYGLKVIHDTAHCLDSDFCNADGNWRKLGSLEEPMCFSLYATKCLTSGEGGMIATNDPELAATLRRISFHGITSPEEAGRTGLSWDYDIDRSGYKSNLNDILASLGLSQLARAGQCNGRRNTIALRYLAALGGEIPADLPVVPEGRTSSWHLFPIRLHREWLVPDRDALLLQLRDMGVGCAVHWRPLHHFRYYRELIARERAFCGPLPVTDDAFPRLLSLPLAPDFSDEEVDFVISTVKDALRTGEAAIPQPQARIAL